METEQSRADRQPAKESVQVTTAPPRDTGLAQKGVVAARQEAKREAEPTAEAGARALTAARKRQLKLDEITVTDLAKALPLRQRACRAVHRQPAPRVTGLANRCQRCSLGSASD